MVSILGILRDFFFHRVLRKPRETARKLLEFSGRCEHAHVLSRLNLALLFYSI